MRLVKVEQFLSCSIWKSSVEGLDRVRLTRSKAQPAPFFRALPDAPISAAHFLSSYGALPLLSCSKNAQAANHNAQLRIIIRGSPRA